ncbi:MAG: cell division protein ZapA [Tannerellaceae bacterium]|jgi:cell division protein ZapA|nr:cell division protein ZapA [Tannerellaceae bacterium]
MSASADETFLIHVDIANGSYGLRVRRDEEYLYRRAAEEVRALLIRFGQRHGGVSRQETTDLLAMTSLQLATEVIRLRERNDTSPFSEALKRLTQEMGAYLETNRTT